MLHVAKYLPPFDGNAAEVTRAELDATLDLVQPGWREHVVHQRFLPHVIVDHGLATAPMGGLAGRPGPEVPGMRMLYVAGDWVGPEGLLADASFASAHQAAQRATAALAATGAAAA